MLSPVFGLTYWAPGEVDWPFPYGKRFWTAANRRQRCSGHSKHAGRQAGRQSVSQWLNWSRRSVSCQPLNCSILSVRRNFIVTYISSIIRTDPIEHWGHIRAHQSDVRSKHACWPKDVRRGWISWKKKCLWWTECYSKGTILGPITQQYINKRTATHRRSRMS